MRLAARGDIPRGHLEQCGAARVRVVEQCQVRCDLPEFRVDAQYRARDTIVGRADVGMHESIRQRAVEVAPEQPDLAIEILVADVRAKRQQQFVELADIHGHARYGGHVVIRDHQRVDRFVEGRRGRQLQVFTALTQNHGVVGQHVARPVRCVTFVHVADDALVEGLPRLHVERRVRQQVLGLQRQVTRLLRWAQRSVVGDAAQLADGVLHGVAP